MEYLENAMAKTMRIMDVYRPAYDDMRQEAILHLKMHYHLGELEQLIADLKANPTLKNFELVKGCIGRAWFTLRSERINAPWKNEIDGCMNDLAKYSDGVLATIKKDNDTDDEPHPDENRARVEGADQPQQSTETAST